MIDLAEHNSERIDNVRSQKAGVLLRYRSKYNDDDNHTWKTLPTLIIQLDDDPQLAYDWMEWMGGPMFVRTCPLNPRHGVLESTKVDMYTIQEVVARLQEIMMCGTTVEYEGEILQVEADPLGSLIVQPFVEATSSAVYAPGMHIVLGEGHEGVTAGTDGISLAFPVRTSSHESGVWSGLELDPDLHQLEFIANLEANLSRDDMDYHSTYGLSESMDNMLVQIRGCDGNFPIVPPPKGVSINGAVPCGRIEVKKVWVASGLESVAWLEANITKDTVPAGYVISEPSGSLSSHIAAHAKSHELPYIVGEVKVGDSWVEAAAGWVINDPDGVFTPQPWDPTPYHKELLAGIDYANRHWRHQHGWFSTFFHQWYTHPHKDIHSTAYLGGVFIGWMLKSCLGLCLGEMRHAVLNGKKKNITPATALFLQSVIGGDKYFTLRDSNNGNTIAGERTAYYYMMEDSIVDWVALPKIFKIIAKMFNTGWVSGYGGAKWGNAAQVGADTAEALVAMMESPTPENTRALAGKANLLENVTHNNGFLYNKFLSKTAFDVGTDGFPSDNMGNIFYVYEMALDILKDTLESHAEPTPNDWRTIGDFFLNKTPKYWRENPVFLNDDLPQLLKDEREHLRNHTEYLHANTGHNYGDYYNSTPLGFILCGEENCSACNTYHANLEATEDLPDQAVGDDGVPYDVWTAGNDPNIVVDETPVINTAKHKEYAINDLLYEVEWNNYELDKDSIELVSNLLDAWYTKPDLHCTSHLKGIVKIISQVIIHESPLAAGHSNGFPTICDLETMHKVMTVQFTDLLSPSTHTLSEHDWAESYAWLVTKWMPLLKETMVKVAEGETMDSLVKSSDVIGTLDGLAITHTLTNKEAADISGKLSKQADPVFSLLQTLDKMITNGKKVDKNIYDYVAQHVETTNSVVVAEDWWTEDEVTEFWKGSECSHMEIQGGKPCLFACCEDWMDDVNEDADTLQSLLCPQCTETHHTLLESYEE